MCTWLCRGPWDRLRFGEAVGRHSVTPCIVGFPGTTHHSKRAQGKSAAGEASGDVRGRWARALRALCQWGSMGRAASPVTSATARGQCCQPRKLLRDAAPRVSKKKSSGIEGIGHVGTRSLAHTHIPGSQRGAALWHSPLYPQASAASLACPSGGGNPRSLCSQLQPKARLVCQPFSV